MRLIETVAEEQPEQANQLLWRWLDYIIDDRKTELRERLRTVDLYRTKRFLIGRRSAGQNGHLTRNSTRLREIPLSPSVSPHERRLARLPSGPVEVMTAA